MSDYGSIHKNVEEMYCPPDPLWDHGFYPAGHCEDDHAVESEYAESKRERIHALDPKGNERIRNRRIEMGIKEEAYSVKKREKNHLEGKGVVDREGVGGGEYSVEYRESDGDTKKDDKPCKGKGDKARSSGDVPRPGSWWEFDKLCDGSAYGRIRRVERVCMIYDFGSVEPSIPVRVGLSGVCSKFLSFSFVGETVEIGVEHKIWIGV